MFRKKTHIQKKNKCTETVNQDENFHLQGKKILNNLKEQQSIYYIKYEKLRQIHNA